jgi:hypothetical protein
MPTTERIDARGIANRSGFPLQIGIQHLVQSQPALAWSVVYAEHAWTNPRTGETGFIDLVLRRGPIFLVIECKRTQPTQWVFFRADAKKTDRRHAKCWVSHRQRPRRSVFSWHDVALSPESFQAPFCAVHRQDAANPMLERICGTLIEATEALAHELRGLPDAQPDGPRFFFNVIVTNATLEKCLFDPADVDLETGEIVRATAEAVPFVRFRKHLSTVQRSAKDLRGLVAAKENTVFVVNASAFADFLGQFELDGASITKFT